MRASLHVLILVALTACSFDDDAPTPIGGALTVSGDVVDFQTSGAIGSSITISASGLQPAPRVTTAASAFVLTNVPENSVFQVLAAAPPTHRATFSAVIEVIDQDVDGLTVPVVSETYLASLATAFNVTPTAARGVLFVRLVDGAGAPRAGIAAANLAFTGGPDMKGPFFLDANMMPAPAETSSSASGWVVYFEVAAGSISVAQAAAATVTVDMATSPINVSTVTLAEAKVTDGAPPGLPVNVSFSQQVFPIFGPAPLGRGCVACHSANGVGRKLGNLALNASNLAYKELTENSIVRVNLANPEASLVLTKPLLEVPPNHQNAAFASPQDPDYLKILVWIREGAKNN